MTEALLLELGQHLSGRVDARQVLRLLQNISNVEVSMPLSTFESLWNHDLLLDDCILVSGMIFVRSRLGRQDSIESILAFNYQQYKHADWVRLGILRGLLVVCKSSLHPFLSSLFALTGQEIHAATQANRLILVARHLENLAHILELEYEITGQPAQLSQSISLILSKTLLLKSDLVEYKSRDVIKLHYQKLASNEAEAFLLNVLNFLPEIGKVALQCFDAALDDERGVSDSLAGTIFEHSLPLIKVKGLGHTAAKCVAKTLKCLQVADSLLSRLFQELSLLPGSKEKIAFTKGLFSELDAEARAAFKGRLQSSPADKSLSNLLLMLIEPLVDQESELLSSLLADSDEYYSFEAFSVLVREAQSARRKPTDAINSKDLELFQGFLQAVSFSASIELRQKVIASSKAFYEQIFGRLYHLIRDKNKNRAADLDVIDKEIDVLLTYLRNLFLTIFIEPFDFVSSNYGSLEFVLKQILLVIGAFEGNVTLAGANAQFMKEAQSLFREQVITVTVLKLSSQFLNCVGYSTYDSLRLLCSDILCKCQISVEEAELEPFYTLLGHPRAINNEGAARMIQLFARLQSSNSICSSICKQINDSFCTLRQSFPSFLLRNNVNGRLLTLRFLLCEANAEVSKDLIESIIQLTLEISSFVSGVASHPSPEGLDLEEQVDAIEADDFDVTNTSMPSSQYVLSFAWRAIKESSMLLEAIVCKHGSLVAPGLLERIAGHFIHLLLTLRHRGAFSSVEGPLTSVLKSGFTFPEIKKKLAEILQVALQTEEISCTRRSAGLPHLILAMVHSCSKSCEIDELLSLLIPQLTDLAANSDDRESPSLIHAFNITRSLVRDSKLAPELSRHVGVVALMCLNTFNSASWSVRNASSMLLSSLISRIFGSAHLNHSVAVDQIDLRELEVKFYGLLEVIESFMSASLDKANIEARLAYPLLAVLERIKIPINERFDTFRLLVRNFLLKLVRDLSANREGGRKLIHVVSRVFCSLLENQSLATDSCSELLANADWTQANSVYNHIVLVEALNIAGLIDEQAASSFIASASEAGKPDWNPIVLATLQSLSHNNGNSVDNEAIVTRPTPVESNKYLSQVLESSFVAYRDIESCLNSLSNESLPSCDVLFVILNKFKLNEAIVRPTLRLLCQMQQVSSAIDARLGQALLFYSSFLSNENDRLICLEALKHLHPDLLLQIPEVIFNVLLDDSDDIRREGCEVVSPLFTASKTSISARSFNLLFSLRAYIQLIDQQAFRKFLYDKRDEYCSGNAASNAKSLILFEQEPLNEFFDLKWLEYNFIQK